MCASGLLCAAITTSTATDNMCTVLDCTGDSQCAAGLNGETLAYGGIDGDEAEDRFHDDKENGNNSAPAAGANDMGAETCAYEDDEF